MSLRAVNHNLLPILLALLRERNVTSAARSLGLSQPAVSRSLIQLRAILGDELLVRVGRRFVLTRRGEDLLGPVATVCEDMDKLWRQTAFDPTESRREFVIAGTDYCALLLVPALAPVLAIEAAGISMRFVNPESEVLVHDRMDIDFAMVPDFMVPKSVIDAGGVMPLFIDDFVAVVGKDHPLAVDRTSPPADVGDTRSILFGANDPLLSRGPRGGVRLTVPSAPLAIVQQFTTLPLLAVMTGAITVLPRRFVDLMRPTVPLHIVEGIVPERRVTMVLAWHHRRDADADHRWFRNLIAKHLRDNRPDDH